MNVKPAHLKKDSNPHRQKKNESDKLEMKEIFTKSDLMNIPKGTEILNEDIYVSLVSNLEKFGLSYHLKELDVASLIEVANTMAVISDSVRNIKKVGNFQKIVTREGHEKWIATPFAQTRSTHLNNLQAQLKQLQLDPQSRQLLQDSVLNDVNMFVDEDDSIDLMKSVFERLN